MKTYYTYLYLREDGTPYYIGKGCGHRAYISHQGHRPPTDRSRILIQEFPSEADALFAEMFLIAYYGRKDLGTGILRNRTDGGESNSGRIVPASYFSHFGDGVRKSADKRRGKSLSLEHRQKCSQSLKGHAAWDNGHSHMSSERHAEIGKQISIARNRSHVEKYGHERVNSKNGKNTMCAICRRIRVVARHVRTMEDQRNRRLQMKHSKTAEPHSLLPNQKSGPQTVAKSGPGPFKGTRAGEKRAGNTKYVDYPGQPEGTMNYKGAVGDCK
jgi:hypothetical protein